MLKELEIPFGAPGGMEQYRLTLALSFLHKFLIRVQSKTSTGTSPNTSMHATQIYPMKEWNGPVGRPLSHISGVKHTKGATYVHDIRADEALYAYPVSPSE